MILLAFVCLGFLIGNLVGLSAESTLSVLVPLLFAFAGGSAIAFLHKLSTPSEQRTAGIAVIGLSLSCLLGVYVGIVVSEYQLLSPTENVVESLPQTGQETNLGSDDSSPQPSSRASIADRKYLRTVDISLVNQIDHRLKAGEFTTARAYEELYRLVSSGDLP